MYTWLENPLFPYATATNSVYDIFSSNKDIFLLVLLLLICYKLFKYVYRKFKQEFELSKEHRKTEIENPNLVMFTLRRSIENWEWDQYYKDVKYLEDNWRIKKWDDHIVRKSWFLSWSVQSEVVQVFIRYKK